MNRLRCTIVFLAILAGCGSREHTYGTVQEARAANVFARYLPDVLPTSSKGIFVRHKRGSAGDSGVFFFDPRQRAAFFAKLSGSIDPQVWGDDFSKRIPTLGVVGLHPLAYHSPEGDWVFFCADGNGCTTCTWLKR
jgi:hypothetical protein